jgi:hypothetical protein
MHTGATTHLDRLDRHVWRSFVRMSAGTSRYRATCALEEALRLSDLPGEREGRVYYFRRVSLGAIPAQASRLTWMERVQQTLGELAATAVHGSDPRAAAGNAVFFDNQEQALEAVLRRSLRTTHPAWFSAGVLGDVPEASGTISILRIIERLRQPDLPQGAAAAIILSSLGHADPAPLLDALPISMVRDWLREMEGTERGAAQAIPMSLPGSLQATLRQAAQQLGWKEPRTLWLATLGAMAHSSTPLAAGEALRRARETLRWMAQEAQSRETRDRGDSAARADGIGDILFESDAPEMKEAAVPGATRGTPLGDPTPAATSDAASAIHASTAAKLSAAGETSAAAGAPRAEHESAPPVLRDASWTELTGEQALPDAASEPTALPALLGEPTAGAGLYFLLHALRHLGIAETLAASPNLVESCFVLRLLERLATHAGVPADDPILRCLDSEAADLSPPSASPGGDGLLRIWAIAVRRWCRRQGGITVREIVRRRGRVWLTRRDLDVTLPLAAADVRIRRIGLDIDPGWVPWFGRFGRVVRFHYSDRGPDA